jgi:hypothetical protein
MENLVELVAKDCPRDRESLAMLVGPGSTYEFNLVDTACEAQTSCNAYNVSQVLDLLALSVASPVVLRLAGVCCLKPNACGRAGVCSPSKLYCTLFRYGEMLTRPQIRLSDVFILDCRGLIDCDGLQVAPDSLMLLKSHGHGSFGSIQLMSRALALRLLKFYPTIYSI